MDKRESRKRRRKMDVNINIKVDVKKLPPQPMTLKQMKEHAQQSEEASITVQPTKEERLHQDLTCSICTSIAWQPVQTECDHIFCKQCLNDWMRAADSEDDEQAKCPMDRKAIDMTMVKPLKEINPLGWKMIGRIEVKCPRYESLGCDWIGEYSDAYDHVQHKCAYSLDLCQWCLSSFQRRHLDQHESDNCHERPIVCSYCEESIPFKDMDDHIQHDCSKVSVQCTGDKESEVVLDGAVTPSVVMSSPSTGCGAVMVRSSYQLHLRDECPATLIPCSYARHGCSVGLIKRGSMSNHLTSNMSQHLELVTATLAKTNNKLDRVVDTIHKNGQPSVQTSQSAIVKQRRNLAKRIEEDDDDEEIKDDDKDSPPPKKKSYLKKDREREARQKILKRAQPNSATVRQHKRPVLATDLDGMFDKMQRREKAAKHQRWIWELAHESEQDMKKTHMIEAWREQQLQHTNYNTVPPDLESLADQILERQNLFERQQLYHQIAREADEQMQRSNMYLLLRGNLQFNNR